MKILLVRHGETDYNKKHILMGKINPKLNRTGIKQAKKLARRLSGEHIDAIFSSDYLRARETAEIINSFHGLRIRFDKRLREQDVGIFEGKPRHVFVEAMESSGRARHLFKPEGGESKKTVQRRALIFLKDVIKKYPDKTVLIVSHGALIAEVLFHFTGMPRENYHKLRQKNTALNIIEINKRQHVVKKINCTRHLRNYRK
jgi:broad specificity phosphatase PhoE